jgi:peptidoglycan hydrolase-like protein with peptidoglycan-binding domain
MLRSTALISAVVLGAVPAGAYPNASGIEQASIVLAQAYPAIIERTRQIQLGLKRRGYDPGPVDGLLGRRTARAIRAFQADHGLAVTGMPSRTVYEMLTGAAETAPGTD